MVPDSRLGIIDDVALAHVEERTSKWAALALCRDGSLDALELGTFATLASIQDMNESNGRPPWLRALVRAFAYLVVAAQRSGV